MNSTTLLLQWAFLIVGAGAVILVGRHVLGLAGGGKDKDGGGSSDTKLLMSIGVLGLAYILVAGEIIGGWIGSGGIITNVYLFGVNLSSSLASMAKPNPNFSPPVLTKPF